MNGKIVLLALVFIFAASGASIGLQAASGRVEIPKAKQLAAGTPTASQPENADSTADATSLVKTKTPASSDCLPVEATLEAPIAVTEEVIKTEMPSHALTATPDCFPFDATPDVAFTPEATFDVFFATPEATEDSGRGRNRGGEDGEDEDHSGKGGRDDNSGRGSGDD